MIDKVVHKSVDYWSIQVLISPVSTILVGRNGTWHNEGEATGKVDYERISCRSGVKTAILAHNIDDFRDHQKAWKHLIIKLRARNSYDVQTQMKKIG